MIKEAVLHIDGIDRSGKDSIRRYVVEKSDGKILVIIRSYISQIVYSRIYKRNINEDYFISRMIRDYENHDEFVLLTASDEVINQRCIDTNEKHLQLSKITKHRKCFLSLVDELKDKIKINVIDTSIEKPEVLADKILKLFEER